jgi:peptidoglycan-associated lipoprotein
MRYRIRGEVLLAGFCVMAALTAGAQDARRQGIGSLDVGIVYNSSLANGGGGNEFWLQGGSVQIHGQFWRGLGVVADVAGLHAGNTNGSSGSTVGLDLVTATFGPRYTWTSAHRPYAIFGEVLAGEANGLNSVFPSTAGARDSATSLGLQVGGGVNVHLRGRLSVRAFEADWLRTQMPNATTNVQNNLRLGAGLIFRLR